MEEDVPGSFDISRTLHQNSICWLPRCHHSCRWRSRWMDHRFLFRRAFRGGRSQKLLRRVRVSLVPLHGLSPIVKSLRIFTPSLRFSHVFNLVLSFPLLEDLDVTIGMPENEDGAGSEEVEMPTAAQLSSPPRFTGTLELCLGGKIGPVARRLLSLPSGIHFRKIALVWLHEDDLSTITAFVEKCSHTLESLDVGWNIACKPILRLCPHR
jgi:hypothetical protein